MRMKNFLQSYYTAVVFILSVVAAVFLVTMGVYATTISSNVTTSGITASGAVNASSTLQVTGAVTFYGSATLQDVTIQGTCSGCGVATAGGWTDTGATVRLDSVNDLVEIGTNASTTIGAQFSVTSTTTGAILFGLKGVANQRGDLFRILNSADGQLLTFSAGGNLGIGTSTPGAGLSVATSTLFTATTTALSGIITPHLYATSTLNFYTVSGAPRMLIDASGNLAVGTTSPAQEVSLVGDTYHSSAATTTITIFSTSGTQGGCIEIEQPATAGGWVRIYAGTGPLATTSSGITPSPGLVFEVGRCQ